VRWDHDVMTQPPEAELITSSARLPGSIADRALDPLISITSIILDL